MLALKSSPVTLVTPGTGKYVWPVAVYVSYHFATTPYVTANLEMIDWLGAGYEDIAPIVTPFFAAAGNRSRPWSCDNEVLAGEADFETKAIGVPLVLSMDAAGANPTGGDGTATVILDYRLIDTAT
jgi:hypothetical protein